MIFISALKYTLFPPSFLPLPLPRGTLSFRAKREIPFHWVNLSFRAKRGT